MVEARGRPSQRFCSELRRQLLLLSAVVKQRRCRHHSTARCLTAHLCVCTGAVCDSRRWPPYWAADHDPLLVICCCSLPCLPTHRSKVCTATIRPDLCNSTISATRHSAHPQSASFCCRLSDQNSMRTCSPGFCCRLKAKDAFTAFLPRDVDPGDLHV